MLEGLGPPKDQAQKVKSFKDQVCKTALFCAMSCVFYVQVAHTQAFQKCLFTDYRLQIQSVVSVPHTVIATVSIQSLSTVLP